MARTFYFDMDGTVADLYNTEGWLDGIRAEQGGVFKNLSPMVNLEELTEVCLQLMAKGDRMAVITWLPMQATYEYELICAEEKRLWIKQNLPFITEVHCQPYGVPKQNAIVKRTAEMILVDDNAEVRKIWETEVQRKTIDATKNIIEELRKYL